MSQKIVQMSKNNSSNGQKIVQMSKKIVQISKNIVQMSKKNNGAYSVRCGTHGYN